MTPILISDNRFLSSELDLRVLDMISTNASSPMLQRQPVPSSCVWLCDAMCITLLTGAVAEALRTFGFLLLCWFFILNWTTKNNVFFKKMPLLALQFLFVTEAAVLWGTGLRDCLFPIIFCNRPLSVPKSNNRSALPGHQDHTQVCIERICDSWRSNLIFCRSSETCAAAQTLLASKSSLF